jgi:hypothetical protein
MVPAQIRSNDVPLGQDHGRKLGPDRGQYGTGSCSGALAQLHDCPVHLGRRAQLALNFIDELEAQTEETVGKS